MRQGWGAPLDCSADGDHARPRHGSRHGTFPVSRRVRRRRNLRLPSVGRRHVHALAPYTYWYDHPPLGWIMLAGWTDIIPAFTAIRAPSSRRGGSCWSFSCKLLVSVLRRPPPGAFTGGMRGGGGPLRPVAAGGPLSTDGAPRQPGRRVVARRLRLALSQRRHLFMLRGCWFGLFVGFVVVGLRCWLVPRWFVRCSRCCFALWFGCLFRFCCAAVASRVGFGFWWFGLFRGWVVRVLGVFALVSMVGWWWLGCARWFAVFARVFGCVVAVALVIPVALLSVGRYLPRCTWSGCFRLPRCSRQVPGLAVQPAAWSPLSRAEGTHFGIGAGNAGDLARAPRSQSACGPSHSVGLDGNLALTMDDLNAPSRSAVSWLRCTQRGRTRFWSTTLCGSICRPRVPVTKRGLVLQGRYRSGRRIRGSDSLRRETNFMNNSLAVLPRARHCRTQHAVVTFVNAGQTVEIRRVDIGPIRCRPQALGPFGIPAGNRRALSVALRLSVRTSVSAYDANHSPAGGSPGRQLPSTLRGA